MLEFLAVHPLVPFAPLFGAALASFLTVVAERVPQGRSINGRSSCACGRALRPFDGWRPENVPVLGWVAVGGRARCCGARLPVLYVANELVLAVGFTVVAATVTSWPVATMVLAGQCGLLVGWSVPTLRR